jgi:hypothetical protein
VKRGIFMSADNAPPIQTGNLTPRVAISTGGV